jgi:hypothetical protein
LVENAAVKPAAELDATASLPPTQSSAVPPAKQASAGLIKGNCSGRMSSGSSGNGTWSNVLGCAGDWTLAR